MTNPFPSFVRTESEANFRVDKKSPGVARAICPPDEVRLPRTATRRNAGDSIKVLERVTDEKGGFAFQGSALKIKPGGTMPKNELKEPTVLLECAGTSGGRGHNRGECLFILWRFKRSWLEGGDPLPWEELARASSVTDEWALCLKGVATRAMNPEPEPVTTFNCDRWLDGVISFAESGLAGITGALRLRALERLQRRIPGMV